MPFSLRISFTALMRFSVHWKFSSNSLVLHGQRISAARLIPSTRAASAQRRRISRARRKSPSSSSQWQKFAGRGIIPQESPLSAIIAAASRASALSSSICRVAYMALKPYFAASGAITLKGWSRPSMFWFKVLSIVPPPEQIAFMSFYYGASELSTCAPIKQRRRCGRPCPQRLTLYFPNRAATLCQKLSCSRPSSVGALSSACVASCSWPAVFITNLVTVSVPSAAPAKLS